MSNGEHATSDDRSSACTPKDTTGSAKPSAEMQPTGNREAAGIAIAGIALAALWAASLLTGEINLQQYVAFIALTAAAIGFTGAILRFQAHGRDDLKYLDRVGKGAAVVATGIVILTSTLGLALLARQPRLISRNHPLAKPMGFAASQSVSRPPDGAPAVGSLL